MENQLNIQQNYQPQTLAEANQIISLLKENLENQQEKIATIELQYHNLRQQLANLLQHRYGKRSEKLPEVIYQISLFDNQDLPQEPPKTGETTEAITYVRKKRNGHRHVPQDLPKIRIEYKLEDLTCPCGCGNQLHKIGETVTEQLEIVPAKIYVKQHARFKYAGCLHNNQVITAPMPRQPIDKGFAGPGLLADVLVKKYDDHLPLYRQAEILARHGIDLAKQTLGDWVMQCADLLSPIVTAMQPDLLSSPKIHTDDTEIPVLEKGRGSPKKGRLWGYLGIGPPCVIYEYSPNRQQIWPENFLKDYKGYLQADAYTGYDKIYARGNIIEVACQAHARRKFFEIVQAHKKIGAKEGIAVTALTYIGKLYQIERRIKSMDPIAKKAIRKREAASILKDYKKWLIKQSDRVLPKSPLGQAVSYTLNNWIALTRYLGNGILSIDNNAAERLMRPITVGRSNYVFAGNDRGGKAAATIYSIIETCKLNKINPYEYLVDVLTRLPNTLNRDIKSLLPYHWQAHTSHQ